MKFWLILTVSSNFWQDFSRFLQQLKKIDKDANFDEWAKVLELRPFNTLYLQLRLLSVFFDHLCCSIRSYIWVNWRVAIILFRHTKFEISIVLTENAILNKKISFMRWRQFHMENNYKKTFLGVVETRHIFWIYSDGKCLIQNKYNI